MTAGNGSLAAILDPEREAIRGEPRGEPASGRGPVKRHGYTRLSTADIFAPLPVARWVIEPLQLTFGRPNMLIAPGGAGKTIIAQSIALAVASGRRLWGQFPCKGGNVLHIDHDQGGSATRRRYQRQAAAEGIEPEELGGRLEAIIRPPFYLNGGKGSEDTYLRECDGVSLCIVDAFRGANPGADENESRVRDGLDMLARVSEKTHTAFLVLHHSGKPRPNDTDAQPGGRGSSAIDDGSGAQIVVSGKRGEPKRVSLRRDSQDFDGGPATEPFYLVFEDAQIEGWQRPALRVVYRTVEQIEGAPAPAEIAKFEDLKRSIVAAVRADRTGEIVSKNAICVRVRGAGKDIKLQAIDELLSAALLVQPAGEGTPFRVA